MWPADLPVNDIVRCAGDAAFLARMSEFYRRLDAVIAARRPVCVNRGACCRFSEYGHRMYVEAAELAWFLGTAGRLPDSPPDDTGCPYQQGGVCTVRSARPMACRIFFCDPATTAWQADVYEPALAELRAISAEFSLPGAYVEWTAALAQFCTATANPLRPMGVDPTGDLSAG